MKHTQKRRSRRQRKTEKVGSGSAGTGGTAGKGKKILNYNKWCDRHKKVLKDFTLHRVKPCFTTLRAILNKESKAQLKELEEKTKEQLRLKMKDVNVDEIVGLLYKLSQSKTMGHYKKLIHKCTKGMTFVVGTNKNNTCFDMEDNELSSGAFGQIYVLKDDPKKVVKIENIRLTTYDNEPLPFRDLCLQLKRIQLEVDNMKLAAKVGVAPKMYEHVICMNYENSSFQSCIVMQHAGTSLQSWLETNSLTPKDKTTLKALLKKLHDNNILHNDIHSGNILVNDKRRFYFIDYGQSTNDKLIYKQEMAQFEKRLKNKKLQFFSDETNKTMADNEKLALQLLLLHSK